MHFKCYTLKIQSDTPLPLPVTTEQSSADVCFLEMDERRLSQLLSCLDDTQNKEWFACRFLSDGSIFVSWPSLAHFWITPDAKRIEYKSVNGVFEASYICYLLSQILSFILIRHGYEPLHASVVTKAGRSWAFVGPPGSGKSSLAAYFIQNGYKLVTDDLLILKRHGHQYYAQPGPSHLKAFENTYQHTLSTMTHKSVPMNPETKKWIIDATSFMKNESVPLSGVFLLSHGQGLATETLGSAEKFFALVRETFNPIDNGNHRLTNQIRQLSDLVQTVPVVRLKYPRRWNLLSDIKRHLEKYADAQREHV